MFREIGIIIIGMLTCQCTPRNLHLDTRDLADIPPFDAGYGIASACVFKDSIVVSIPMGGELLKPVGTLHEVCTIYIKVGDHLSSVVISAGYEKGEYIPLIYKRRVRRFNSHSSIFDVMEPWYRNYPNVVARYNGVMYVIFGSDWSEDAWAHRPDRIHLRVGTNHHGTIPIQYHCDESRTTSGEAFHLPN